MQDRFSETDNEKARTMGWRLEFLYDARGYFTYAVTPSLGSSIRDVKDAQKLVWDKAKQGDKLCRRALAIVTASELAGKAKPKTKRKTSK